MKRLLFSLLLIFQIFQNCNLQTIYRSNFKSLVWLKGFQLTQRLRQVKKCFDDLKKGEVSNDPMSEGCVSLKDLVNKKDRKGLTPLSWAAFNNEEENIRLLLEYGADSNIANSSNKKTPLNIAAGKDYENIVDLLLNYNADPNLKDKDGKTALSWAAGNGHLKIVEKLICKKADVNISDNDGQTALHWAASNGYFEIVELLLKNGADINFQDNTGGTALSWAVFNNKKEIVKLLLECKANPDLVTNKDKMSALHWASDKDFLDIVKLLVVANANSNLKNKNGETPLSLAAFRGNRDVLVYLLKDGGADFSSGTDSHGMNVLMFAIQSGSLKTVETVIHYLNFHKITKPFKEVDRYKNRTVLACLDRMHPRASEKKLKLFNQTDFDVLFKRLVDNYISFFDPFKQDVYGGTVVYWLAAVGDHKNLKILFDVIKSSDVDGEHKIIELLYKKNEKNGLTPLAKINRKIEDVEKGKTSYRHVDKEQVKADLDKTKNLLKSYLNTDISRKKRKKNVVVSDCQDSKSKEFKRRRYGKK